MSSYSLTKARVVQYVGILFALGLIAVGYWYFSVRAGVKMNTSALQPQGVGDLSAGLAGYWKLDEGSGTTAADASTNGNNGTFVNSPTWTTGQIGQGLTSFSTTTYVSVPHSAALNSLPFTLSFWVKTTDSGSRNIVIGKDYVDGYRCQVSGGNMRCWFLTAGGGSWYDGGDGYSFGNVADNQWHLITMVITASGGIGYVDGVQTVSQPWTGGSPVAPTGTGALQLGTGSGGTPVNDFTGSLDEVRIYNRSLSADEVVQLYRLTAPTSVDTSLKGYWSFNANAMSSTTAYDWSGAGKNLTLNNGPIPASGRVGQGLSFDGTNDYASGTYTPSGPNTISAWIYPRSFADNPGMVGQLSPNYNSYGWGLSLDTSGNVHAISGNDNITWYNNLLAAVPLNQWSHVTVTFSNCCNVAATGYLYINGVQVATYTGTADTYPYNFAIGARDNTSGTVLNYFNGSIDEVRIYNRALSVAEIKSLYDRGAPDRTNSSSSQAQGTGRLDSGLKAYYPLDNGSGTTATDASTNGNNGTLTNGPTWTTGQIGGAVTFDGSDDYVGLPAKVFGILPRGTASFWVKGTNYTAGQHFIYEEGAGFNNFAAVWPDSSSSSMTLNVGSNTAINTTKTNFSTGTWYQIAINWDGTTANVYVNGVLDKSVAHGYSASTTSGGLPQIGRYLAGGSGGGYFNGSVDEFRVYNRVLSADEVGELYRLTSPTGTDTSLKGYWSFNGKDLSGTTAYDRSGAGNDGTLTGGPTVVNGIIGQALSLDGTNDVVQITSDAPNITGALTASFWLKTTATSQKTILGFWQTTGWMVELDGDGSGPGKLSFYSNNSGYKFGSTAVNDGNWHYVAFTLTGGGVLTIYRDGVVDGSY
ncbi:MAG: LamG-like jellyroll fold domain-containing protein [Undibacterium sp.]